MTEPLQLLLDRLRIHLDRSGTVTVEGDPQAVLFFSFTDGLRRAEVVTAVGPTVEEAWQRGVEQLKASARPIAWLRLDWVDAVERSTWRDVMAGLDAVKRNYFRLGIALDPAFRHAFLETELNANAMLYGGNRIASAVLNVKNFRRYAKARHGLTELAFRDDDPVWLFTTKGAFVGDDLISRRLAEGSLDAGRRSITGLDQAQTRTLVEAGSRYLASQVQADGRFHYGWHPCFDRAIGAYNTLRHASTLYAMLEAWELTRDGALFSAIERGLRHLATVLIKPVTLPGGTAAFLVEANEEVKLGGNAVAVLALAKHAELTGSTEHRELLDRLGAGILHMQDPTGAFAHVLRFPSLEVKERFRIVYYDGEAAFALMRLYALTGDERWLAAVEGAFAHFIRERRWEAHDHWLGYCANELTRYRPHEAYFAFGLANVRDHLDFVLERVTTFPTLLELMVAAEDMIGRLRRDPSLRYLLGDFDLPKFYRALEHRANYLLNGHFWPELAMFYANPAKIVGSFFIRHHAFRVRIDDVEHYLSGLVGYHRYLEARSGAKRASRRPPEPLRRRHWTAADVARATGGRWLRSPPAEWSASGLCKVRTTFRPGDMVAVEAGGMEPGVPPARLAALRDASAWIVAQGEPLPAGEIPALVVPDIGQAILSLGGYARTQMRGKVIGVTGSAGKTSTVAMLAHVLEAYGAAGATRHSANVPHGVAWNLASIPWDTPHVVLELAIGRMQRSARLARPDVALFTNILPAHLQYHRDLATIARRKSAMFNGMDSNGIAVLNRDMCEWERVRMAAHARGLGTVAYGVSAECSFRLLDYDPSSRLVSVSAEGRELAFSLGAAGEHMALNAVGVLATLASLGLPIEPAIARFESFVVPDGRGRELSLVVGGRPITVLDASYNANPGSMRAAIEVLVQRARTGRRIAILGEMCELGPEGIAYHDELAAILADHAIEQVHLVGELFQNAWSRLPRSQRGQFAPSTESLDLDSLFRFESTDTVLFKGSHRTGIHKLVLELQRRAVVTHS